MMCNRGSRSGARGIAFATKWRRPRDESIAFKNERKKMAKATERAVLVTTAHRGVFFGYASETSGETIKLRAARLCVYWSADLRGFMGLASAGPNGSCKVGPAADLELRNITAVVEVSEAAVKNWEKAPWNG
jgi:Domain of unknown function (DUF6948)